MIQGNDRLSLALARAVMEQLVDSGITHLVASPGYRNAPLLLAAHRQEGLQVVSAVDERGAAFLALGLAKGGSPAAVVCTSGTAVANFYPALMEADHSHIPLLFLTADRPPELVGTGANQCTNQSDLFGGHARLYLEIGCPVGEESSNHARYTLAKSVAATRSPRPGPVHVNIRFREPFLPDAAAAEAVLSAPSTAGPGKWKFIPSASGPSKEQWEALESMIHAAKRPLFLVGAAGFSESTLDGFLRLTEKTGIPVLAENVSGLPFRRAKIGGYVVRNLDALLQRMATGTLEPPDLLLRLGSPLTGKGIGALLKANHLPQVVFEEGGASREPHLHPSIIIQGGLDGWLNAILNSRIQLSHTDWRNTLLEASNEIDRRLSDHLAGGSLSEWHFHHGLEQKISDGSLLFLGNSMPIRDFNSVFPPSAKELSVHANRGLSGIDGLIATAAGLALASGKKTHAVIGDLSTLHDLSSFSLLSSLKGRLRLTLWVMNNGGGEIFRIVPTAATAGPQEWFTTPQPFDLAALAKAFQLPFLRIATRREWEELGPDVLSDPGVRLIEVLADKETNTRVRQSFRAEP